MKSNERHDTGAHSVILPSRNPVLFSPVPSSHTVEEGTGENKTWKLMSQGDERSTMRCMMLQYKVVGRTASVMGT